MGGVRRGACAVAIRTTLCSQRHNNSLLLPQVSRQLLNGIARLGKTAHYFVGKRSSSELVDFTLQRFAPSLKKSAEGEQTISGNRVDEIFLPRIETDTTHMLVFQHVTELLIRQLSVLELHP